MKQEDIIEKIPWHAAFVEAIKLELEDYKDSLEFIPEGHLDVNSVQIDCVIIKKNKKIRIKKNIGRIFKDVNLLEFKKSGQLCFCK